MALAAMGGVLLIYAQAVTALGVGEPRYLSHLFEPLRVDIPVDAAGVNPAAVKVGVSVSGLDPDAAAALEARLHREWRFDARGGYVLRITADEPVDEPLMQLRVEVGDDRIQTVRELTLLFDPAPIGLPEAPLLAESTPPVLPAAALQPVVAAVAEPVAAEAAVDAAPSVVPPPVVKQAAAVVAAAPAPKPAVPARPVAAPSATAVSPARQSAAAQVVIARPALLAAPALIKPIARGDAPFVEPSPISAAVTPQLRTSEMLSRQVASTHRPHALSAADRWQRIKVTQGDTLDSLAVQARGAATSVPLPMVAMLLRWLNPRSFDGIGSQPLVGAELRFPKAESLAAQIAVSGGVWTVDDITASTADAASSVPPPSFQLLRPLTAEGLAQALPADPLITGQDAAIALGTGSLLFASRPAASLPSALSGARGGVVASTGVLGGAVLAGVLSMLLMLKMVVTTPLPQASRYVPGVVMTRAEAASASAAASVRVLPAESVDVSALDFPAQGEPVSVHRHSETHASHRAES